MTIQIQVVGCADGAFVEQGSPVFPRPLRISLCSFELALTHPSSYVPMQLAEASAGVLPELDPLAQSAASALAAQQDDRISRLTAEVEVLRLENAALNDATAASETKLTVLSLENASLKAELQEAAKSHAAVLALEAQLAEANRSLSAMGVHSASADARAAATAAESAARLADTERAARVGHQEAHWRARRRT